MTKEERSELCSNYGGFCKKEWVGLKDKPVAWGMEKDGIILDVICPDEHEREEGEYTIPLYTKPQLETKDEPVGWIDGKGYMICVKTDESCRPLYTTPQRTWVGLTDEEIFEIHKQVDSMQYLTFGKAIEAKLKERNT
jgi:hypothetical protein